jgi:hypothetical protein
MRPERTRRSLSAHGHGLSPFFASAVAAATAAPFRSSREVAVAPNRPAGVRRKRVPRKTPRREAPLLRRRSPITDPPVVGLAELVLPHMKIQACQWQTPSCRLMENHGTDSRKRGSFRRQRAACPAACYFGYPRWEDENEREMRGPTRGPNGNMARESATVQHGRS